MTFEDTLRAIVREELRAAQKERDAALIEKIAERLGMVGRPEYASTTKAARLVDMNAATIRRWLRDGVLRRYRVGGRWRVKVSELEQLIANTAPGELTDDEVEARAGALLAEIQGKSA